MSAFWHKADDPRRTDKSLLLTRSGSRHQSTFAATASIHNHFNQDRHLNRRDIFKQNRFAALAEWRQLAA